MEHAGTSTNHEVRDMPNATVRLIRLAEVIHKTGLPRTTVYRRVREDPSFPRRVAIGGRTVAWVESEVDAWIAAQIDRREAEGVQPAEAAA